MVGLIWTVIVLLAILWLLGFAVNIGWWINVLLVLAVIGIVFNLVVYPLLWSRRTYPSTHEHEHVVREEHYD